jgi:hypothetical protein
LTDLDADGRQDIVLSGISNGYDQATMVVLDPDRVQGASVETTRPDLQLHGLGTAQEKLRILFPRSDMNQKLSVYNQGGVVSIQGGSIRVQVIECAILPGCDISYRLNRRFELLRVEPNDPFLSAHKQFYAKSPADHPFSPREEEAFRKIRCLSGCPGEFVRYVGN